MGADGQLFPSPRQMSSSVFNVSDGGPINNTLTVMQWGQFFDYDFSLTPTGM